MNLYFLISLVCPGACSSAGFFARFGGWAAREPPPRDAAVSVSIAGADERAIARETGPALEAQDRFLLRFAPAV